MKQILNRATGQTETWKPADGGTFGVFVFAVMSSPRESGARRGGTGRLSYVVTHGYLETSVPGVYAAGDARAKNLRCYCHRRWCYCRGGVGTVCQADERETGLITQRPTSCVYAEQSTAKTDAASLAEDDARTGTVKRSTDAAAVAKRRQEARRIVPGHHQTAAQRGL